ncbi:MAG: GNAT family N-acetyltransferase [Planctomycetes bacterium]|nr:GNAT family N-acetyltransferase [Planctomycetota bacterium]
MEIRQATIDDLDELGYMFDQYRQSFHREPDRAAATEFMSKRLTKQDSVLFMAIKDAQCIGFAQLYPTFASVAMQRIFTLNDMFVLPAERHSGVATELVLTAEKFAKEEVAVRLLLEVDFSNNTAQKLFEKLGWEKDEVHYYYEKDL